ncbi:phenylalanyl-tRNA synthetase beta subunit [Chitinophaga skermanii]|uniref:Phenylalanine--tRNA ligase beta subunit n=1 Tax=Chitinophaga skermanii TaxID=331697 RepID=A0A327R3Z8_9BACT|nr:phenylalanine--tRNA ligase subunit beta [Chitinophaga skermanii]RAJ10778.1 phenylalanyl-tRNA synthetase beta subunit [Chitinophaga skermanii]
MTISYNWLCDYLPVKPTPEELSVILTSIGLEVESLEKFESVKGSLAGLVIGEVLSVEKHPNADKLNLTKVNIGSGEPLAIVCGAPNVAAGQKVVVAPIGTTIYPASGEPLTMKKAKIRGEESNGMICAEDEVGLGASHAGIMVLDPALVPGTPAADIFQPAQDYIFEIGLTPNHMDAMSHMGVARDICSYLSNHNDENKSYRVVAPAFTAGTTASTPLHIDIVVENEAACPRYCGTTITGVTVTESPKWLKDKLQAIGIRAINNIVDITNFVLHETGQPLHAFDAAKVKGNTIRVKNLPTGTPFVTLDEKERTLDEGDLMICDGDSTPLCIAGVFGGFNSGVKESTTTIFLESALFAAGGIRRTSLRHGLRTDAAVRFEKGVDISNVKFALERAAALICELGGGQMAAGVTDVYPVPKAKVEVSVTFAYINKLSGHTYEPAKVIRILEALGFEVLENDGATLKLSVPYHKTDISIPADIVEEVLRIDGLNNVPIPTTISIAPSIAANPDRERVKEKIADYLAGNGFNEIFTNSITNSQYFTPEVQATTVKMINSLTNELDVLRPSMLETGLERITFNLNRKNDDLLFFEFGKTYLQKAVGDYVETHHLALYLTGNKLPETYMYKAQPVDFYFLKGYVINILTQLGLGNMSWAEATHADLQQPYEIKVKNKVVAVLGSVSAAKLKAFDIKPAVWYADIYWDEVISLLQKTEKFYVEIPKFPAVRRDLALVLDRSVSFAAVEAATKAVKSNLLQQINLFDVFESEKLGANKKSYAVSFTFLDTQKTLTDKEIDAVMDKLVKTYETQLQAIIRK